MSLIFDQKKDRYLLKWVSASGQRKYKTLPKGTSEEGANKYHDAFIPSVSPSVEILRSKLIAITAQPENHGNVYAITNPVLPGIFKIGMTAGFVNERLKAFNTAHPFDWVVFRSVRVTHMAQFEKIVHEHFSAERINRNREFFEISENSVNKAFDVRLEIGDAEIRAKDLHRK